MDNNAENNGEVENNQTIVSINIPITTTEEKLKETLTSLGFDAPLPRLDEVDQINLQITIKQETE